MLTVQQANALVYCSLCGFMLVGLYAGYRVKSKVDFLSGIRSQSAFPLSLNWIASNMSSSLLFGYPQVAVIPTAGLLGLSAYCFSTVVPLWAFAWLGPAIRRKCPDGFTLSEYIRRRFGWPVGVLAAVIFCGFMLCFMITELNTYGYVVSSLGGVDPTIAALIVAITTTIYTTYGGFKASLWTDNVQGVVVMIFIIMATVAFGVKLKIQPDLVESSGLTKGHSLGGQLWYILPAALIFSQMFNQGFWQRAFASRSNKDLYVSVIIATPILFAICFLVGVTGPLAQWSGLWVQGQSDGSDTFFIVLGTLPDWVQGIILVLASALSCSAYDTLQSAQISTLQNDVFLNRVPLVVSRVLLLALNVPSVVLAVKNVDILEVFLIADLGAAAALPAPLLGLVDHFWFLNGFDVFVGAMGGFFTVFIFGTIYLGSAYEGGKLITLPNDLYVSDYSVLGAFLCAPLGSVGWSFVAFAFRAAATWVFCRWTGREYTVFNKRNYDTSLFVLPDDKPVFGSGDGAGKAELDAEAKRGFTGRTSDDR